MGTDRGSKGLLSRIGRTSGVKPTEAQTKLLRASSNRTMRTNSESTSETKRGNVKVSDDHV